MPPAPLLLMKPAEGPLAALATSSQTSMPTSLVRGCHRALGAYFGNLRATLPPSHFYPPHALARSVPCAGPTSPIAPSPAQPSRVAGPCAELGRADSVGCNGPPRDHARERQACGHPPARNAAAERATDDTHNSCRKLGCKRHASTFTFLPARFNMQCRNMDAKSSRAFVSRPCTTRQADGSISHLDPWGKRHLNRHHPRTNSAEV